MTARTKNWSDHTIEDRYVFDFEVCHFRDGWAQCDTKQDASWFGMWANPLQLRIMSYAEGDMTLETADSPADFCEMIRAHAKWNIENGHGFKIDGMCQDRIIDAFHSLGLGEFLH